MPVFVISEAFSVFVFLLNAYLLAASTGLVGSWFAYAFSEERGA
jgi:hypothetical protein